jgi:hypothetical protein
MLNSVHNSVCCVGDDADAATACASAAAAGVGTFTLFLYLSIVNSVIICVSCR